jgi:small subunit ribosomal protein S6
MQKKEGKVYEVGYIIVPSVSPDHVAKEVDALKAILSKNEAEIVSEEAPKMKQLAYPMLKVTGAIRNKFDTGYFGWIKFSATAEAVLEIKKAIDLSEKVLRHLLITTVAENTLYGAKLAPVEKTVAAVSASPSAIGEKEVEKLEINQEELDKSIDKLVI